MDMDIEKTQKMVRKSIRGWVQKEILPRALELSQSDEVPRDLWRQVCNFDVFETVAPRAFGGHRHETTLLGIAAEEIAKGDVSLAGTLIPNAAFILLMKHAETSMQAHWIPAIMSGKQMGAFAITEPDCGTDAAAIQTKAVDNGDGYILNGKKTAVGWGMCADVVLVLSKIGDQSNGKRLGCFLLPLPFEGVRRESIMDMGLFSSKRASIEMDYVKIPKSHLIGGANQGFITVAEVLNLNRVMVALASIGAAAQTVEETIAYVKKRVAFGKPVAKYEGVSFPLAESTTRIAAARALCYQTLRLKDQSIKHTKESAMCKWWATEIAVRAIHDALILHGHYGYSKAALIEQRLRDVIGLQLADGSPEGMKLTIVKELMGKEYLPF